MRRLKILVALVLGVAVPVVLEGHRLRRFVPPHAHIAPFFLINIVSEMNHEVELVGDHVAICAEETMLVVLARGESKTEALGGRLQKRCGARATDDAFFAAHVEAIPIRAGRLETFDLDVHRVRPIRRGERRTAPHDARHAVVACDFPVHENGGARHPAAHERHGRKTRPEDETLRKGIAGSDAQRERVRRETYGTLPDKERRRGRGRALQEMAS